MSNNQLSGCPQSCFVIHATSQESLQAHESGIRVGGNFVEGKYKDGRPTYYSLTSSHHLLFNSDEYKWEIWNASSMISDISSNATQPPSSGWSNNLSISTTIAPVDLLQGTNAIVSVSSVTEGQPPNFENIIFSTDISESAKEVQQILLSWSQGIFSGFFKISFLNPKMNVKIGCDDSAEDLITKLESLPSIGRVDVVKETGSGSISWTVTFLSNVGDLQMLQVHCHHDHLSDVLFQMTISLIRISPFLL